MRKITLELLALGFVGTMAISVPSTTKAQGIYVGPGVGVQIGTPNRYRYNRRYYRGYNSYAYDRRPYIQRNYYNGYGYNGYGYPGYGYRGY